MIYISKEKNCNRLINERIFASIELFNVFTDRLFMQGEPMRDVRLALQLLNRRM